MVVPHLEQELRRSHCWRTCSLTSICPGQHLADHLLKLQPRSNNHCCASACRWKSLCPAETVRRQTPRQAALAIPKLLWCPQDHISSPEELPGYLRWEFLQQREKEAKLQRQQPWREHKIAGVRFAVFMIFRFPVVLDLPTLTTIETSFYGKWRPLDDINYGISLMSQSAIRLLWIWIAIAYQDLQYICIARPIVACDTWSHRSLSYRGLFYRRKIVPRVRNSLTGIGVVERVGHIRTATISHI